MHSPTCQLPSRFFDPFDSIYRDVTAKLRITATGLPWPEGYWLEHLIEAFLLERGKWNSRIELDGYRKRWACLRPKILKLAAGAYLHVSYDLPRVLADDWPGEGRWETGPDEREGFVVYTEIQPVFDDNLIHASRRFSVMGSWSLGSWLPLSQHLFRILNNWLFNLRRGAWEHGRILALWPDRERREAAMAEAITKALEDTAAWKPWTIHVLRPPDTMAQAPVWTGGLAALLSVAERLPIFIAVLALAVSMLAEARVRHFIITTEARDFLAALAARIQDYMDVAVREPDSFAEYRERRLQEEQPGLRERRGFAT